MPIADWQSRTVTPLAIVANVSPSMALFCHVRYRLDGQLAGATVDVVVRVGVNVLVYVDPPDRRQGSIAAGRVREGAVINPQHVTFPAELSEHE